jgi:hypothetical protein
VIARLLQEEDAALLDRLIDVHPFKPYRHFRVFSRARQTATLRAEVERTRSTAGSIGVVAGDGRLAAVALCRPLSWDSAFFGVPMARLDHLLRGDRASRESLEAVVAATIADCRTQGIRHLAARVDVADMDAVPVLERAGFRLMDALVTYFTHPRRAPPTAVKEFGHVRPMQASDGDQLVAITREAYQGYGGRFHLDPHLPRERSDEFYVEWARQCVAGRMADRIVVADDGHGGIHGWASTRLLQPVSSVTGVNVFAGSLGACRRDRPGSYAGLIRALALENFQAGAVTETQTQNHNVSMVRIYEAVGAEYARADYTFHLWLG